MDTTSGADAGRDAVQEYLDRLRSMHPSESLTRAIDEVERQHQTESRTRKGTIQTGFRGTSKGKSRRGASAAKS